MNAMQGVTSAPGPPGSAGVAAPLALAGAAHLPGAAATATAAADANAPDGGRPPPDVLSLAQSRLGDLTTSMYTYLGILQSAAPAAGETMGEDARRQQEGLFEKAPEYAKEIGSFGADRQGGVREAGVLWFSAGRGACVRGGWWLFSRTAWAVLPSYVLGGALGVAELTTGSITIACLCLSRACLSFLTVSLLPLLRHACCVCVSVIACSHRFSRRGRAARPCAG